MKEPSSTFCILPWMHVAPDPLGRLRACCISARPAERFDVFRPGDLEAFWNSDEMRELRLSMLRGERSSICASCHSVEDSGAISMRMSSNREFAAHIDAAVASASSDGSAPLRPTYWDIRLGNLCNLRCRMCGPHSSSMWVEEARTILGEDTSEFEGVDWHEDSRLVETLADHLKHAEKIYFAGGEPTLSRQHMALLGLLVEAKIAPRVRLLYSINATNIPNRMLDLWSHFQSVRVKVSVDAVGDLNRYIRYPTDWTTLDRNVRVLGELALQDRGRMQVALHATFQAYNALRFTELLDYATTVPGVVPLVSVGILRTPSHLSARVLPLALRQAAAARIHAWIDNQTRGNDIGVRNIAAAARHMLVDGGEAQFARFVAFSRALDASRGDARLQDVLPELAPYL